MHDPSIFTRDPERAHNQPSFRVSTAQVGIVVFFVSLGVLFVASLVAYVITRTGNPEWRAGMPGLPLGLLASTGLIAGLSGAMHWGLASIRKNRNQTLTRALWLALVFAIAFLAGQALNWSTMAAGSQAATRPTLYPFTFYLLTGLHALHVIGGFVPHLLVLSRAKKNEYSSSRHQGVMFATQYWDFLGVVWLVLLTTLWLFT